MSHWTDIAAQISMSTGSPFIVEKTFSIGGGCISETYRIEGNGRLFFVKLNNTDSLGMFDAEAAGLQEIHKSRTLRVPLPVCWGKNKSKAWLVLEYVKMDKVSYRDAAALGSGLAAMHRFSSERFGWVRDNTIGATSQINRFSSNWIQFWREYRFGYQLKLAQANGYTGKLQTWGEQLMAHLDCFFPGPEPAASLLHGDLWSGNYGFDRAGKPILFDPAVYYGDRETDVAMTELFGGFSADFYAAYRETYPLDPGYATRKTLYNLYHILNHLNLFGGGYRHQAEQMMGRLLAEIQ
ncbi:Fructosamine-3-kinase [Nitrosospira sp. Nl5]|uniref:fructosamine kinase family protein n=1 Tax=Nitrosospira sp. Nl5 TaxID=200120 RepID=UPI0008877905|nr:fructosamine kinase family protein [Nitrosospira sp. Nl5]SCY79831.1 Fructosamine-3-kinase [Nitrosospira sp. Nl5]